MEPGKKEVIIYKKFDKNGNEISSSSIYMIDEVLAHEYIASIQLKEEHKNSFLVKKFFPKDLFQQVESRSMKEKNPVEKYKYEKDQQFKIYKYDNEPTYLKESFSSIKII